MVDNTDSTGTPDSGSSEGKAPRRRASAGKTAGPKSAADHVNASTAPVVADAEPKAKRAPRGTSKSDAEKPAKTPKAKAGKAAGESSGGAGSPFAVMFQAPDLPTVVPGTRTRGPARSNDTDDTETSTAARRRTRRRSGESPREGEDAPNTVVRVRQPRRQPEQITEPQRVKGSTRLEAKKQRRRDGRDAGRRRPVITEAEFLARRESVDRVMVVRSKYGRIQIGVLEDGVLVEHYVARAADASLIGNVYLGRVQNVLPSMEAAFVDIGRGRNAVLYSGEVDWEAAAAAAEGEAKNQPRRIELALKPGDKVLVQVTKDPIGHKGARLTSQVSLPGRYLVYVPNGSMNGISRKLPDTERARLKKILKEVLPDDAGVIVRTAAEGATEEQLTLDVERLTAQWNAISTAVESVQAPALLHSEPDLLIKIVRDVFNEDFQKLVVEGDDALETISSYVGAVAPDLADRLERYENPVDSFDQYRISEQIEKALDRKVWLPSGGSLIVDRTEAMTVVDVNTGKFVGSGGNLEETVTKNNLEAAEEIVRQLRLRDIGGIIVVDFIDMVLETNRDLVLRRLVECLSRDRTKHQVAEVTSLGLVQMTRKKLGLGLLEAFSENCDVCAGRGLIVHHDPVFKHRSPEGGNGNGGNGGGSAGSSRGRRGRGGGSSAAPKNGHGSNGTHAITEDVRNALAQIAKSTVHPAEDAAPVTGVVQDEREPDRVELAAEAAAEAAVEILEIPVAKATRSQRRISTQDAEQILGSVLEALPEPSEPGTGRVRRSRRAGSSGAVVATGDAETTVVE
jgi:ribonuclease E